MRCVFEVLGVEEGRVQKKRSKNRPEMKTTINMSEHLYSPLRINDSHRCAPTDFALTRGAKSHKSSAHSDRDEPKAGATLTFTVRSGIGPGSCNFLPFITGIHSDLIGHPNRPVIPS